ncbi:MAG: DUF2199 domain-containing protein [Phycisphaerae bacterium]|nr:DUF2199 domain-containing protein [Phycisphaerae bacterium]
MARKGRTPSDLPPPQGPTPPPGDGRGDPLPSCFGAPAPWREAGVTDDDFPRRVLLSPDQCIVDGVHYYLRGHIELPIRGRGSLFVWSVWCSVSEDSHRAIARLWHDPDRVHDEPRLGWLMTELPGYPRTTARLKTFLHQREVGVVPRIQIEPGSHPLADEQARGITLRRWRQLVRAVAS